MLIINPNEPCSTDIQLAGGKAANLSHLVKGGFNVPPFFILSTQAYLLFLKENSLNSYLSIILSELKKGDLDRIIALSAQIREKFLESFVPEGIIENLKSAIREKWGAGEFPYLVIRSSANLEDLTKLSFAGIYESHLNIKNIVEMVNAIKLCWASLWGDRAIIYRNNHRFPHENCRIALIIQEMVKAEKSGVVFTANPLNWSKEEVVINSVRGLGDALVSGSKSPDQYVVGKYSMELMQFIPADRNNPLPMLNENELKIILQEAKRIETYFNEIPQDIEWAIVKEKLFILQARPISTMIENKGWLGKLSSFFRGKKLFFCF